MSQTDIERGSAMQHELPDAYVERAAARLQKQFEGRRPKVSRRRLFAFVPVVAAAVGIVVALALLPASREAGRSGDRAPGVPLISTPVAAAEVLGRAADSAAAKEWHPLRPGEFHHVYQRAYGQSSGPDVRPGAAQVLQGDAEYWLAANGALRTLSTGNPLLGYCERGDIPVPVEGRSVTIKDACGAVFLYDRWTPTPRSLGSSQALVADGKVYDMQSTTVPYDPETSPLIPVDVTPEEAARIPAHGAGVRPAVRRLLDESARRSPVRVPDIAIPVWDPPASAGNRFARIVAGTRMLATAPLPPAARQVLFDELAAIPGAKARTNVADRLGRRGTSVEFSYSFDRQLPAEKVTDTELVRRARARGNDRLRVRTRGVSYRLPARRVVHLWTVALIIDEKTGELLQSGRSEFDSLDVKLPRGQSVMLPGLVPAGVGHETLRMRPASGGRGSGSTPQNTQVWVRRDRVDSTRPTLEVCKQYDELCETRDLYE